MILNMTLKIHILDCHLNYFSADLEVQNGEQNKCFEFNLIITENVRIIGMRSN